MLLSIYIKNFVLIDEVNINFQKGFSVITGETGSGKSIIIDALSLFFKKKVETSVIRKNQNKCIIETAFDIKKLNLKKNFIDSEIEYSDITIFRKEINSTGKSRNFINDSVVSSSTLIHICENIFHIHSQNENYALSDPEFRLKIIDSIANSNGLYENYQENYEKLEKCRYELSKAKSALEKLSKEIEFNKFQTEQLGNAKLNDINELENLENEISILENTEEIKNSLYISNNLIGENESSILNLIKELKIIFSKISKKYKSANDILDRIEMINSELKDIKDTLSKESETIEANPEQLEILNSRIDLINNLLLKHHVKNISELKLRHEEYIKIIQTTDELENSIEEISAKENLQLIVTKNIAEELSKLRNSSFLEIETKICETLKELGIQNGVFKIQNETSSELTIYGYDNINFLFSANKFIEPELLEKVASGGEYSRLMLALNSILANSIGISSIIFDEIDTGVSGEIANKMGKIMKKISKNIQVISVTHLPQVAAIGDFHYKVFKYNNDESTISGIKNIDKEERITEIASMISGEKLTQQAIENAKILLKN
ncbi:MAG: DNA repair protein RecN [Bacteroidales bacterium]|jgi:DNA repair protein RecN (Recombination protein N)|nr:DNA repair protein RecN [Bacteroidales bacterium]